MLDTIWVYYEDMTFEQFAEIDDDIYLFSQGTYEFADGGNFLYREDDQSDHGNIIITRTQKYKAGEGLAADNYVNKYALGTLGFVKVYPNDTGAVPEVISIFSGNDKQPFTEEDGEQDMIDTTWIYFNDGTFKQYAEVEENDQDQIVLFSLGTYEFEDGGDFVFEDKSDHDRITISRTQKYQIRKGLVPYESTHTYELGTLGFTQLSVITDAVSQ